MVESAILARERLPLLTKSQPTSGLVDYFTPWIFGFDDGSEQLSPTAARIRRQNEKKNMEESSQRAHATFENGADPSGPDRGLNLIALRSRRAASGPRGAPGFAWSYFAPQRVPRFSQSQESATTIMHILD